MAKNKGKKNGSSSSIKTAAKKRSNESRAFRKLSLTFASKLGVDEPQQNAIKPKPKQQQNFVERIAERAKKKERRQPRCSNVPEKEQDGDGEQGEFERTYASLVEREHASKRTRTRSKKERSRQARREALAKKKRRAQEEERDDSPATNSQTSVSGVLRFQAPTFSLQKSTADLVNEAAAALNDVALREGVIRQQQPFGTEQPLHGAVLVEWHERNPNHRAAAASATLGTGASNPFQSLQVEDLFDDGVPSTAPSSFAFQPASFAVTATTTVSDMIDPDL